MSDRRNQNRLRAPPLHRQRPTRRHELIIVDRPRQLLPTEDLCFRSAIKISTHESKVLRTCITATKIKTPIVATTPTNIPTEKTI